MHPNRYTINCDLGEGVARENEIVPLIDRASIACGGHIGDHESIQQTLRLVKSFGKKAGAHPSYPDRENFGRKSIQIPIQSLLDSISAQLRLFQEVADSENVEMDHIKFHGALYNDAADQSALALALVGFLKEEFPKVPLLVPPHSELEKIALKDGLSIQREIFGDRAYLSNYRLAGRSLPHSLFTTENEVISHLDAIFHQGQILTISGDLIPIQADTVCFHGDNPGVLDFLPPVISRFWN